MAWLVSEGRVLATIETATSVGARTKGLLGRDGVEGAILLAPARSVHSLRMRFPIDVAFVDRDGQVLHVCTLRPNRFSRVVWKARSVVEAEAGSFERWGLTVGDVVDIREGDAP